MSTPDLESAIAASHAALSSIVNGDSGGYLALFADDDEVTLGNPFGPFASGRKEVAARLAVAASNYRDGVVTGVDLVAKHNAGNQACIVEVENVKAKVGGSAEPVAVSLRVTSVFRFDGDNWKLVHRHADPITTARPAESVVNK